MSCLIMNPEPLAALANAVETRLNCGYDYWGFEAPDVDVSKYVVHRPPEYREHGFAVRPWHYQLAMLLDFWLYHTGEDATRSDPLRLAMEEFRDSLYRFIIRNSPQYVGLRWGELPAPDAPEVAADG